MHVKVSHVIRKAGTVYVLCLIAFVHLVYKEGGHPTLRAITPRDLDPQMSGKTFVNHLSDRELKQNVVDPLSVDHPDKPALCPYWCSNYT